MVRGQMFIKKHRVRNMLRKRLHMSDEELNTFLTNKCGLRLCANAETIKKNLINIYRIHGQ